MPPKKGQSSKTEQKQKAKVIEDKTFGLKNKKKSAKVQKYVQQVTQQVQQSGNKKAQQAAEERKLALAEKKKLEEQKKAELAALFKPIQQQKVPFGVDPKTVLCQFFKSGQCQKGDKCKFSHDVDIDRKTSKIDLYTDRRLDSKGAEKENDTMDKWDQKKLEEVVQSKHGNPKTTTEIICKHFLDAVETGKYGWFWICPGGGDSCKYRHALPPGFVLKKKAEKKEKSEEETISLEEFLETERHKLGGNLTPVTLESFTKWKKDRLDKKAKDLEATRKSKESAAKAGKVKGLSGRDLFTFNPELAGAQDNFEEGDDAFDLTMYRKEEEDEEGSENKGSSPSKKDKGKEKVTVVENGDEEGAASSALGEGEVDQSLFEAENLDELDDVEDDDD